MEWRIPDYAYNFFISVFVSSLVFVFAFIRRKHTVAARVLAVLMFLAALWSIFYILELSAVSERAQFFANDLSYIPIVTVPVVLLIFIMIASGKIDLLNPRRIILLFILPVIILILIWTSKYHHLFYASITFVPEEGRDVMTIERGLFYWVFIVYAYLCLLAGTIMAFTRIAKTTGVYRHQAVILALGTIIPWLGSISDILFGTIRHVHFVQASFLLAGIVFMVGIYKFKIASMSPIARDALIDRMDNFMMVLNTQNLIIDMNPALLKFLQKKQEDFLGNPPATVFQSWDSLINPIQDESSKTIEVSVPGFNTARFLQISRIPLYTNRRHVPMGTLFMMNDITERIGIEQRLKRQLETIHTLKEELREQSIRDSLTELYNRRYQEEISRQMFSRAQRENETLAVLFIDIDNFKDLNDQFGHQTGDVVLKRLSRLLMEHVRDSDVVSRYGGEEFLVLFPNISKESVLVRGETIRRLFESEQIPAPEGTVSTTFSAGLAIYPEDGKSAEAIIEAADQAMYKAKRAGKNRIVTASSPVEK